MSRVTHGRSTRKVVRPKDNTGIKTSTVVLNSLDELGKAYDQPKTISHSEYSVEIDTVPEIYNTIQNFSELSQKIVKWYDDNEIIIKNQDQLASDMLHEFELGSPKDLYRAYQCYSKLRKSRQLRRKAKTENKMLAPIYAYIKQNPTLPKDVKNLCERCAGIQYDISHAQYYYKSDLS